MKKFIKLTALLLALLLVLPLAVACNKNNGDNTDNGKNPANTTTNAGGDATPGDNKYADIAGEYILDASNLGMPIKRYIKISADGKFVIGADRTYTSLKGDGSVGNSGDTYMFLYSDSTNESPKTATFKFEGVNMVFSTSVPIGSASISPNTDENIYPVAKKIVHEELLGTYSGNLDKATGMGTVPYTFEITLGYGLEYTFSSSFTMMGTSMTRVECGTFAVDGEKITFTATVVDDVAVEAPVAVEGTLTNSKITAPFKLSAMASAADTVEMSFAKYAEVAGTYTAKVMLMGSLEFGATIVLDSFGGYKYTTTDPAQDNAVQYEETGSFTIDGGKIVLTASAEGATPVEGTITDFTITAKLYVHSMITVSTNITFYSEAVSGEFSATATTEAGAEYVSTLLLYGNTYTLGVAKADGTIVYACEGTFEIQTAVVTSLVLTATKVCSDLSFSDNTVIANAPDEVKVITAPVSDAGINAGLIFDLDDTATIGFSFSK